jgi:hypothetical protein
MEKEFIPYELALELKQLGFDEDCFYVKLISNPEFFYTPTDYDDYPKQKEKEVLIPTYSQAFRWFREKHNLEGEVHCIRFNSERLKGYQYAITSENYRKFEQLGDYHTYEEAELACLKKLIKIVK